MFSLKFLPKKSTPEVAPAPAASCPTQPCATCRNPMPIVGFDQRCPRCRSLVKASSFCPGACSGCEMGKEK
jgi:hypothetical protein